MSINTFINNNYPKFIRFLFAKYMNFDKLFSEITEVIDKRVSNLRNVGQWQKFTKQWNVYIRFRNMYMYSKYWLEVF